MKQLSLGLGLLTQEDNLFLVTPNLDQDDKASPGQGSAQIGFKVYIGKLRVKNNEHGGHVKWKLIKVTDTLQGAILATRG
jgi:hypothetical protein